MLDAETVNILGDTLQKSVPPFVCQHFEVIQTHDASELLEPEQLLSYRFLAEYISRQKRSEVSDIICGKFFKGLKKFVTHLTQGIEKSVGESIPFRRDLMRLSIDPIIIQAIKVCDLAFQFNLGAVQVMLLDANLLRPLIARLRRFQFHLIPTIIFHSIANITSRVDSELACEVLEQLDAAEALEIIYSDWTDWCEELMLCEDEELTAQLIHDLASFGSAIHRWKPETRYMYLTRRLVDNIFAIMPVPKSLGIIHDNKITPFPRIANELLVFVTSVLMVRKSLRDIAVTDDFMSNKMKRIDRRLAMRSQMVQVLKVAVLELKRVKKQRITKMHLKIPTDEHKSLSSIEASHGLKQKKEEAVAAANQKNASNDIVAPNPGSSIFAKRASVIVMQMSDSDGEVREELDILGRPRGTTRISIRPL